LQYQAMIPLAVSTYCTCALGKVEATVSVQQFKHDMVAIVYGQGIPRYLALAQQACSGELQATLAQISAA
jgi:hypothetical protein